MNNRQIPINLQAEINVLSTILVNPKRIVEVVNELEVDDFYRYHHRKIYAALQKLFALNEPIEVVSLVKAIGENDIEKIGVSYLTELIETGLSNINLKYNIKLLKNESTRRKIIKITGDIYNRAYDPEENVNILAKELQEKFICDSKNKKILNDYELLEKTINEMERRYKSGGKIPGMETGFKDIDKAINGLKRGELVVIAGRPSMGKTLLALNFADGLADNDYKVALFEMEMTEESLGMRRLSYRAKVKGYKLQQGRLTDDEWQRVSEEFNVLSKRDNLYTDCSTDNTILDIKAKAKMLKQQCGLDAIIIDHLTLLNISSKDRRDLAIGEITRQCKMMAKELDISVIVLSQLNRDCESRADKRPMLSDLRESGTIEQDADLVILLYRDEYYNPETECENEIEVIIAKQRNGAVGTIKMNYYSDIQIIKEME